MVKWLTGLFDDPGSADMAYENLQEAEYKPQKPQTKQNQTTLKVPVEDVSEDAARDIFSDHGVSKISIQTYEK